MRFWDSSALVPLVTREPTSTACRAERRIDPSIVVWCATRVEIAHALRRKVRDGTISEGELALARRALGVLESRWRVVELSEAVLDDAIALLDRHPLRSADSLQLAAARALAGRARGHVFVTRDDVLAKAADTEGFRVIVPRA